jgi:hypothetical protein
MLIAPEGAVFKISEESLALRWFSPAEMEALPLTSGNRRLLAKWRRILAHRAGSAAE